MITLLMTVIFSADPSGLATALESGDKLSLRYVRTNETIEISSDQLKRLASLVKTRDDVRPWERQAGLATTEAFDLNIGDKHFGLIGWSRLLFGPTNDMKVVTPIDDKLFHALRAYFVAPKLKKEEIPKLVQELSDLGKPCDLKMSSDGWLFVVETDRNRIAVHAKSPFTGKVGKAVYLEHELLLRPQAVAAREHQLFAAGLDSIAVFQRPSKGRGFEAAHGSRETEIGVPSDIAVSPDGKYLYVASRSNQRLIVYSIERSGKLIRVESFAHGELIDPTALTVTETHLYVTSHRDALVTLKRDPRSGELAFSAVERDAQNVPFADRRGLKFASGVAVADRKLYTIGLAGELAFWELDDDGRPQFVKRWDVHEDAFGLDGAQSIAIGPGQKIWVAGKRDNAICWFDQLNKRGMVTFGGKIDGLDDVKGVAVSPDGKFVYGLGDDKLWAIALKPVTVDDDPYGGIRKP